jgi:hypothetical protein
VIVLLEYSSAAPAGKHIFRLVTIDCYDHSDIGSPRPVLQLITFWGWSEQSRFDTTTNVTPLIGHYCFTFILKHTRQ